MPPGRRTDSAAATPNTPLLSSPASLAHHHGLSTPAIRFPGDSLRENMGRRDSYGFPKVQNPLAPLESERQSSRAPHRFMTSENTDASSRTSSTSSRRVVRENSKVYTSFPQPPEHSPSGDSPEQHEAEPAEAPFLQRLFNHHATGAGSAGKRRPDEEVGYRANASNYGTLQHESRPGLPKVSRECLVSEIRCYGSYIMPVLLVFGVLVLVVSLSLYWRSQR